MNCTSATELPTSSLDRRALGAYVLGRRTAAGGYCYYRTPEWGVEEPNAPDTLAALRCLRVLALDPPQSERTARWLCDLQGHDGGYPSLTIGWAALSALELMGLRPSRSASPWLAHRSALLLGRPSAREWRTALRDARHLVELLRIQAIGLGADQLTAVQSLLAAARDRSGGWAQPGADLQTTAQAVELARAAGHERRPDAAVAAFLRRCEDRALGLRFAPHVAMTSAGALWAGLELTRSLGTAPRYRRAIATSLSLLQQRDGGLAARHRGIATLQDTWLGLRADELLQLTWEDQR